MSGMAFSSMRVGKKYRLVNYGERNDFTLMEVIGRNDYKLKDLASMENYLMSDLIQYGKGEDFELREIHE
ncbi:hypothetical protein [Ekhidna sp.]|uniref:hypothetical protein n=1 Tax=Ekhidna sp. TaxID=2608089 RepID=UPI0032970F4B